MPTLIFRTSGRKIKKAEPTTDEKLIQKMKQLNYTPQEIKNRFKLLEIRTQLYNQ